MIDWQWKSFNYGICTEDKQKKMRLSDGFSKLCAIEIETIQHLFYDCELVEKVWAMISNITKKIWNVNCDSLKSVVLGQIQDEIVDQNIAQIMEFVLLSTKWILWKRRNTLKYDAKWTNEDDTLKWVIAYINERTRILLKTKLKYKQRHEILKLYTATTSN